MDSSAPPAAPAPHSIYSRAEKALIIFMVTAAATTSGFASNIYFPSLPAIASDLSVSVELINLTVTSYMILQGLAPSFWGALADVHGRRLTYACTLGVFLAACIGLANTHDYPTLVALRCVQSAGSASTIALSSGVVGDVTTRHERGGYMGLTQAGILVPVAIAPVLGGGLASALGWRAIFWFLAIYSGAILAGLLLVLPETLRALVGNGSVAGSGMAKHPLSVYQRRHAARSEAPALARADLPPKKPVDLLGSLRILADRRVLPMVAFVAVYYTAWQMCVTALSSLFAAAYGLDDTQIGLCFLANGAGAMLGTLATGRILDRDYARLQARADAAGKEVALDVARLRTVWIWSALEGLGLLMFGWTLDRGVHVAAPVVATFFVGLGAMAVQAMVSTYLVDLVPDRSASASSALNLARCLLGAGGSAAVSPIVSALGVGPGFSLLVGIMCAALMLVVLQLTLGRKWREREDATQREKTAQQAA